MDAFKLCTAYRRPDPQGAQDIGSWDTYLVLLSRMAIITNLGLVIFTADNCSNWSWNMRISFFTTLSVGLLLLFELIMRFVSDVPAHVQQVQMRHAVLVDRYVKDTHQDENNKDSLNHDKKNNDLIHHETTMTENEQQQHKMELLNRLNEVYHPPVMAEVEMIPQSTPVRQATMNVDLEFPEFLLTELEGIDAIREAVRRSTQTRLDQSTGKKHI